jgi:uncharacterized membrane protein
MRDLTLLIGAVSVACGVMGGVFFAFSTFVLRALGQLPAGAGIRAMQSINVGAVTPIFMTALFGTGLASAALAVYSATDGLEAGALSIAAGAATYFLGAIVVTIVFNVPLNNALAVLDPDAADAVWIWARYRRQWLAWNHVRTVAGILSSGWFAYALLHPV